MKELIDKSTVVAEIEKMKNKAYPNSDWNHGYVTSCEKLLSFLNNLEVKEVDEQKERMSECPYRQVGCKMYEGKILECNGACGWVVDHLNLKELKVQKGE